MGVLRYIVCLIWSVSMIAALPLLGVLTLEEFGPSKIYCIEKWPRPQYGIVYSNASFALTYAVPMVIMCLLYINIAIALNKVVKEGGNREGFTSRKKKDKVVKMLLALVIAYATCFLPIHVINMWNDYGDGHDNK